MTVEGVPRRLHFPSFPSLFEELPPPGQFLAISRLFMPLYFVSQVRGNANRARSLESEKFS